MSLTDLLGEVERAAGPSPQLDVEIWFALEWEGQGDERPAPPLTASLDSALALVERVLPGWGWQVVRLLGKRDRDFRVSLFDPSKPPGQGHFTAHHNTSALALLASLLKALIADTASPAHGRSQTEDEQS